MSVEIVSGIKVNTGSFDGLRQNVTYFKLRLFTSKAHNYRINYIQ
jgi:hypothetical protein